MVLKIRHKKRKIRCLVTNTGENFSLTISKEAARIYSGCCLCETITPDGIYFKSGCEIKK